MIKQDRCDDAGSDRVYRGSSWVYDAFYCHAAYRDSEYSPSFRVIYLGFRPARSQ